MKETSDNKPPKWGVLVGSKRKLRRILTGEPVAEDQSEILANDLLYGAPAIAEYTGLTTRQIYHQQGPLGLTRLRRASASSAK